MIVLALDTSTLLAGAAIWQSGRVLAERQRIVTTHSDALMVMVDEAFAEARIAPADVDVVVCGAGPGSFTGLRIGLATAKGLAFALARPLVMVSSLAGLAARAPSGRVCAMVDALKGEVYAGIYTIVDGTPRPDGEERVLPPAALLARLVAAPVDHVVGSGVAKYPELAVAPILDAAPGPWAADLARLGAARAELRDFDDLATATPKYIRASEAELVKKKPQQ
ncbi:MAG: tsaB [Myxococcales bacterium]|nr:tsaB [Myxococcales bacterium]